MIIQKILFIIFILIFSILFSIFYPIQELFENNNQIEIIVSRYNEDLEWLKEEPFHHYPVTIYNKGLNENFYKPPLLKQIINLDNVGVCVHSYLYHIINNYENLANVTIFLPGSCMDNHKKDKTLSTVKKTQETKDTVFYVYKYENNVHTDLYDFKLDNYDLANDSNRVLNNNNKLENCTIRPFGKWYETVFPDIFTKYVNYQGIFSVSKSHILNRDKKSYEELIQYVNKHTNEESAHYFERSFIAIFHPIPDKCMYI